MKAHSAQTRTCATQAPPDSCGLGYHPKDHGLKRGNISTDFRRLNSEYPPPLPFFFKKKTAGPRPRVLFLIFKNFLQTEKKKV